MGCDTAWPPAHDGVGFDPAAVKMLGKGHPQVLRTAVAARVRDGFPNRPKDQLLHGGGKPPGCHVDRDVEPRLERRLVAERIDRSGQTVMLSGRAAHKPARSPAAWRRG